MATAQAPGSVVNGGHTYQQYIVSTLIPPQKAKLPLQRVLSADREQIRQTVLAMVAEAGFDVVIADRIIRCESNYNPSARNTKNANGSNDVGLWQLNSIHGLPDEVRLDPVRSTEFALSLMRSKRGYNHWVCYSKTR